MTNELAVYLKAKQPVGWYSNRLVASNGCLIGISSLAVGDINRLIGRSCRLKPRNSRLIDVVIVWHGYFAKIVSTPTHTVDPEKQIRSGPP